MRRRGNRGFTLIEMIVALAIFASLMATLMFGYSQGLAMWERGRGASAHWQSLEYRYGLLARVFAQASAADYKEIDFRYAPYFQGKVNEATFMTSAPVLDFSGRVRPVSLKVETQSDDTVALVYREAGRFNDPGRGIDWDEAGRVTLLERLQSGKFRFEAPVYPRPPELNANYLTRDEKLRYREQSEWLDWYNATVLWKLPQRIEFVFSDENGVTRKWTFALPVVSDAWSLNVYFTE